MNYNLEQLSRAEPIYGSYGSYQYSQNNYYYSNNINSINSINSNYNNNNNYNNNSQSKFDKIICLNCGKRGHIQKRCKFPKNSYGIILYKYDIIGNLSTIGSLLPANSGTAIKFLLIQRKFSYSLDSLISAKYFRNANQTLSEPHLYEIIKLMPYNERYLVKTNNFDYLWDMVWCWNDKDLPLNKERYYDCKEKYQIFSQNYMHLLDTIPIVFFEPDWEFPKGRRVFGETDIDCAIREFSEETDIKLSVEDVCPYIFKEKFFGTNNNEYCNNYFISDYTSHSKKNDFIYYDSYNKTLSSEIRKIGWFTVEQTVEKIKHHLHKLTLLKVILNEIAEGLSSEI